LYYFADQVQRGIRKKQRKRIFSNPGNARNETIEGTWTCS